jgi:hypothetical protein
MRAASLCLLAFDLLSRACLQQPTIVLTVLMGTVSGLPSTSNGDGQRGQ